MSIRRQLHLATLQASRFLYVPYQLLIQTPATRVNIINTNPIQIPLITTPNIFRLLISDPDTALISNKLFSPEIIINAHKVAKAALSHQNKA